MRSYTIPPRPVFSSFKLLNYKDDRVRAGKNAGVCDSAAARSQIVDSKDGEMSEWLKEHAWKTNPARLTETH
jgi:hypothetical protein